MLVNYVHFQGENSTQNTNIYQIPCQRLSGNELKTLFLAVTRSIAGNLINCVHGTKKGRAIQTFTNVARKLFWNNIWKWVLRKLNGCFS